MSNCAFFNLLYPLLVYSAYICLQYNCHHHHESVGIIYHGKKTSIYLMHSQVKGSDLLTFNGALDQFWPDALLRATVEESIAFVIEHVYK